MARMIPYAYRPGTTVLHRMSPGIKLLFLLGLTTGVLLLGVPGLIAAILLCLFGAGAARISPLELLSGSKPLLVMTSLVLLLKSLNWDPLGLDPQGFLEGLWFAGLMLASFSAGSLVFTTTKISQFRSFLTMVERTLRKPFNYRRRKMSSTVGSETTSGTGYGTDLGADGAIALSITLMLSFIPRFFELWEASEMAYRARFGKKSLRSMLSLVPLVTERLMEAAADTARAMRNRGGL